MGTLTVLRLCSPYHTQKTVMHSVFWCLSIRTNMNFFSNLSYNSSSVGSDHTGQPSLPMCISEPVASSPLFLLGPRLIDTDHSRLATLYKSCSFGDALTQQSSHHSLSDLLLMLLYFILLLNFKDTKFVYLLLYISQPLTSSMMKR